jgi:hypothetical protein
MGFKGRQQPVAMKLQKCPAIGGSIYLRQHLTGPALIATGQGMTRRKDTDRDKDHSGVLDRLPPIGYPVLPLWALDRVKIFVARLLSALK